MAIDKKKLAKLKQRVAKFREKHAHDGKAKPKQSKVVGKRGGVYTQEVYGLIYRGEKNEARGN